MDTSELWDIFANYSGGDTLPDTDGSCDFLDCSPCSRTVDDAAFNAGVSALYGAAFALGLAPNLAVLWLAATCHPPGAPVSRALLLLSHTVASLCGLSMLPALVAVTLHGVGYWPSGSEALCKLLFFMFELYMYGSALSVACMGAEQFSGFASGTAARVAMCAASWLLAVGASLPNLVVISSAGEARCEPALDVESARAWQASVGLLNVSLGCAVAAAVFVGFYVAAPREPGFDRSGQRGLARVYFCLFVVCWVPYHTLVFMEVLKSLDLLAFNCSTAEGVFYGKQVTQCLAFLYSCATAWAFLVLRYTRSRGRADDTVQQTTIALS